MEKFNLSSDLLANLQQNFERLDSHSQILPYIRSSPYTVIYGTAASGKTFVLKAIFKESSGTIIYVRSSPKRWETLNPNIKIINRNSDIETFDKLKLLIKSRREMINKGLTPSWATLVFDDIQNLVKETKTTFDELMALLAFSGRHYNLRTIVLLQAYRDFDKKLRSQASAFLSLLPLNDSYRQQVYSDYWRIFKSEFDLVQLEKLPKHSFLFKLGNKRFYYIA